MGFSLEKIWQDDTEALTISEMHHLVSQLIEDRNHWQQRAEKAEAVVRVWGYLVKQQKKDLAKKDLEVEKLKDLLDALRTENMKLWQSEYGEPVDLIRPEGEEYEPGIGT